MSDTPSNRRAFLKASAAGLAALGAGNAFAQTAQPGAYPWHSGGKRFTDKVVLITGATSGIGAATARAFAAEGAKVAFCGRREDLGQQVQADIEKAGGTARYMQADVRDPEQAKGFVQGVKQLWGRVDIAFNNAGIGGPAGMIGEMPLEGTESYHDVIATNLNGVFYSMQAEVPLMLDQGGGVIINTSSVLGSRGAPGIDPYSATKHGVIGLTRSAARQYVKANIRILSVSPGPVDTALLRRATGGSLEPAAKRNPSGRVAQPEEIAAAVLNLAAPESAYIAGEDIKVDGGSSA